MIESTCTFTVYESADGKVQILINEVASGLPNTEQRKLSLQLREGFSEAPARYLAEMLNKHISGISYLHP